MDAKMSVTNLACSLNSSNLFRFVLAQVLTQTVQQPRSTYALFGAGAHNAGGDPLGGADVDGEAAHGAADPLLPQLQVNALHAVTLNARVPAKAAPLLVHARILNMYIWREGWGWGMAGDKIGFETPPHMQFSKYCRNSIKYWAQQK